MYLRKYSTVLYMYVHVHTYTCKLLSRKCAAAPQACPAPIARRAQALILSTYYSATAHMLRVVRAGPSTSYTSVRHKNELRAGLAFEYLILTSHHACKQVDRRVEKENAEYISA